LVDPGSFVEYGRLAIAAQRFRRDVDDLIARTPADGLVAGTARIGRHPCAVLAGVLHRGRRRPTRRHRPSRGLVARRARVQTVGGAWPGAHLGPMGLEGAVRLGLRKEREAIADDTQRAQRVRQAAAAAQRNAKALNAAQLFEIDDVIDPADTRALIAATLTAAVNAPRSTRARFVDTW
jgi:acetyl-CoA carboxylase carboxyltransferase component